MKAKRSEVVESRLKFDSKLKSYPSAVIAYSMKV